MSRHLIPFYLLTVGLLTTLRLPAQTPAGPVPAEAGKDPADKIQTSSPISAAVRESFSAYTVHETTTPEPDEESRDPAVHLPKMVIRGPKSQTFSERELASKAGLADLLRRRYPGASFKGQDPRHSRTTNYAALMLADDVRLEQIGELENMATMLQAAGELKMSQDLKKEITRTFWRGHDAQTDAMARSATNRR